MEKLLGDEKSKIQPKLRMIADGSNDVNIVRSEQCAAMIVVKPTDANRLPILRGDEPVLSYFVPEAPPKLEKLADEVRVNIFVETNSERNALPNALKGKAQRGNLVVATVQLKELPRIAKHKNVLNIELGEPLSAPTPEISNKEIKIPDPDRWRFGSSDKHRDGADVLIGIIDVQGFDFAHPDFLNDNKTRFIRIWDQGGDARPSPHMQNPKLYGEQFDFGAEFLSDHLNQAIEKSAELKVPPQEIECQSQMAPSSHGTHVASIAAGNHGICRQAKIAAVLISLPKEDNERRKSFYDSTRIALAMDYLLRLAEDLNMPISINISLGTNGHAHDGTAAISRWIDSCLSLPGRCVCVAAGNAGQEVAAFPGDIGYVMGRIHTSGKVPGRFLYQDIEWSVVGNGTLDVSENELEIWYEAPDRLAVSVRPPGEESDWIGPIEPCNYVENYRLHDGSFISIYNELYHRSNGINYISIYLSPFFGTEAITGIPSGTWKVRLYGRDVRDGHYHGWIERDDPRRLGRIGPKEAWRFPSFFTEASHVDNSTISSLASGRSVISVANLNEAEERVHITSSQGPTRDNRYKPDVAAPGTDVVAANGFSSSDDPWVKMTGTSMASPFVTGVVGLMFSIRPELTAAQIEGILHRTARPLPGNSFSWVNDAGFGRFDPEACLAEAEVISKRTEVSI